MSTHYDTLGLPKNATADEVRRAHRRKVRKAHPDAGGSREEFLAVQSAYEVLSDAGRRRRYDETGSDRTPSRSQAEAELAKLVLEVAELSPESDVVSEARRRIAKARANKAVQASELDRKANRLLLCAGRVRRREGGNFVKQVLANRAAEHEASAKACRASAAMLDEMDKALEGYECRVVPQARDGFGFAAGGCTVTIEVSR